MQDLIDIDIPDFHIALYNNNNNNEICIAPFTKYARL